MQKALELAHARGDARVVRLLGGEVEEGWMAREEAMWAAAVRLEKRGAPRL